MGPSAKQFVNASIPSTPSRVFVRWHVPTSVQAQTTEVDFDLVSAFLSFLLDQNATIMEVR